MARAAVLGRLTWQVGTVAEIRQETATARTIAIDVPGWPGHAAGQHVDVRLTAEDGYTAQRSYSIASPPGRDRLELTVQRLEDGEVSSYLTDVLMPGYPERPARRPGAGGPAQPGGAGRARLDPGGRTRGIHLRADRLRGGGGQPAGQGGPRCQRDQDRTIRTFRRPTVTTHLDGNVLAGTLGQGTVASP